MDYVTRMAIRAIISGLRNSDRLSEQDVLAVMAALQDAARTARARGFLEDGGTLMEFSRDIGLDNRIGD